MYIDTCNYLKHVIPSLFHCFSCPIHKISLIALSRILDAYRTGRGRIVVRGKTDIEVLDSRTKRMAIIIKEVIVIFFILYFLAGLHQLFAMLSLFIFSKWNRFLTKPTNPCSWRRLLNLLKTRYIFVSWKMCIAIHQFFPRTFFMLD